MAVKIKMTQGYTKVGKGNKGSQFAQPAQPAQPRKMKKDVSMPKVSKKPKKKG